MRVLLDPRGPLDKTEPARRPITIDDLMTHRSGLAYAFSVPAAGQVPTARCRSARTRTDGWPSWPSCRWRISPATGSRTATQPTCSASRCRGSRASRWPRCWPSGSLGHWACPTPDSRSALTAGGGRRRCTSSTQDNMLAHDVMGPPRSPIHRSAPVAPGCGRRSTTTCGSPGCCSQDGTLDGVRVLSEESVRLMRTDRLTDEQKRYPFLGAPFWVGRGFRPEPVGGHRSGEVAAAVRPGRAGHVQLARRLRHVVAGRPVRQI